MKVLLLGATGNVGSRLLPALLRHNHSVVLYVRNPSKLTSPPPSTTIIQGSATDASAIKSALLTHNCDAVINAAGLASLLSTTTEFPAIFASVVSAAVSAGEERGSPLRAWFMSGFGLLDLPGTSYKMLDYVPIYRDHRTNYHLLQSLPPQKLDWSLFCANAMAPGEVGRYTVSADVPPEWTGVMKWVPGMGNYLNVFAQIGGYAASLEGCTDFMAGDLEHGDKSEFVGKRVGFKALK